MVNPYLMHRRRAFRGFAPETTTLLAAFTGSYNTARQSAINDLIVSLKNNGIWSKLDVLCIAGLNSGDSLVNWKNPGTFNGSVVSSPTFTVDRGFTGNGINSYVDTNFNPGTAGGNYTLNSAHIAVYSRTDINQNSADIGADSGSNSSIIAPRFGAENFYYVGNNQTSLPGAASPGSSGFLIASRIGATSGGYYRNGSLVGSLTQASSTVPNSNFFVCRRNNPSFPQYSTRQIAVWSIGGGLNAAEASNFNTALATYLTYIGANV